MGSFVSLLSEELSPMQAYDLIAGAIVPRPIAFVSTISGGVPNLAPFSFFMAGGANPPSLAISINKGAEGRRKDTLRNIEETGEYVVNLVTREMAEGMNQTSRGYAPTVSEWPDSSFTSLASLKVAPARVAESLIHFECRLFQVVDHGTGVGAAVYVIGEIVAFHIAETCMIDGKITNFSPISRMGGSNYLDVDSLEVFEMIRPS